jgi:uncharacterized protein (DUF1501 family)
MSALISDLKERGMLDDTLVIWAGEFGRTPLAQGIGGGGEKTKPGRDHHKDAVHRVARGRRRERRHESRAHR